MLIKIYELKEKKLYLFPFHSEFLLNTKIKGVQLPHPLAQNRKTSSKYMV